MASRKRPAATPSAPSKRSSAASSSSAKTAQHQRALQRAVDAGDAKPKPKRAKAGDAGQAGPRKQPQRMPKQHLAKPGNEHELALQPRFEAPEYVGSGKLRGMSAIVTGADSGIGRAVAVLFAREGADVAVLYLDEHEDAQVTRQHVENEGRRCITIAGDVKDPAFCEDAVAQTVRAFGGLDVLVNNAAFQLHCDALEDLSEEHLQETLQTNIAGYFHMARAALPHLKRGAAIVNSGSETGLFGSKSLLDYSATKGAIHAFTMALASQLQPRGIRVNAVAPGPVWTPLNPADKSAEDVAVFGKQNPMGRPAQPEELSPAYVFLASPITASYINGAILPVMGGPTG
ncbi:NAD(P)-dependent dehydrogenase (short-subunit alcohol dehydrogenase family) [Xanthomonas sacchari]|uniref:SDR family oxidoreductase n=1 Tax=unclassified Xanthomonas TaxID=2643310 RepID=UPI00136A2BCB|nr:MULTISPECIES: SDR family oxidoreductase [unclassified Xanthomonas]MBB6368657.1 NAD(P)-dependent dehydrogenase (short-subunit alcohol dehydrogenase family) [Xanthomonas sp. F10]MXV34295.1 SDR family oxidoreductase [Xanthomonas sp. LMG 8989]